MSETDSPGVYTKQIFTLSSGKPVTTPALLLSQVSLYWMAMHTPTMHCLPSDPYP